MSKLITRIKRLALALCLATPIVSWAAYTTTGYEDFGDTAGVVLWRSTTAGNFSAGAVIAIAEDGTPGDVGTMTWGQFCNGQSAFSAPGKVLVYDKASSDDETPVDYTQNPTLDFRPISFGGMWVKTLAASGNPFGIVGTNDRRAEFGYAGYTTLFNFEKSYTLDLQGAFTFNGTVNVDVAQDAVFSINASYPHQTITVTSGSTLKPSGAGSITIGNTDNGLIVNGTLDLSAETRPTLTGMVKIPAGATLVVPAGTAPTTESPFTVCTGTLTVDGDIYVKVGDADAAIATVIVNGGAITGFEFPTTEKTFDGSEDWPTTVPALYTYTFVGSDDPEAPTEVSTGVAVSGTLKTTGYISLTGLEVKTGGTLEVVDGNTTATAATNGYGDKLIDGNVIVRAGATLTTTQNDFLDWYGASNQRLDIYGTLALGNSRWSVKTATACTFNFYPGARVTGSGDENGLIDLIAADSKLSIYAGDNGGEVVIEGKVKTRNANTPIWVDANTTLKLNGGFNGSHSGAVGGINKSGDGTLEITGTVSSPAASTVSEGTVAFVDTTVALPLTVNAGKTVTVSASEGVTVPLNVTMNASANITVSGAGTVNGSVTFGGFPTGTLTGLTTSTWQGTVTVPAASGNISKLASCGNADSVIDFAGTTGSSYIMASGNTTYNVGAINFSGATVLDNGSSGSTVNFAKISGDGDLTLSSWGGCSSARYNLNKVEGYTGTLTVKNGITRDQGGTFTIGIGNIVTENTTPGACVLPIVNTAVENTTGTVIYNIDNAKLNGEAADLEVKEDGIYIVVPVTTVEITITPVTGATASVTVNGSDTEIVDGKITVAIGAEVVVTYTSDGDYKITDGTVEFKATAETTAVDTSSVTSEVYKAQVMSGAAVGKYTTVASALSVVAMTDASPAGVVVRVLDSEYEDDGTYDEYFIWDSTERTYTYRTFVARVGTKNYDSLVTAMDEVTAGGTVVCLVDTITLDAVLSVTKEVTLGGVNTGTTITGSALSNFIQLDEGGALTLVATVTIGCQVKLMDAGATLTMPEEDYTVPSIRPLSGYTVTSASNGDGTKTYSLLKTSYLYAAGVNVTLAYSPSGDAMNAIAVVSEDDVINFTATPAAGYEKVVVTANSVALTPVDGVYTVTIGTENVTIQATASAMPTVTLPNMTGTHMTVTSVTVGGVEVAGVSGVYTVPSGSTVVVTFEVEEGGYFVDDVNTITIENVNGDTEVQTSSLPEVRAYVAEISGTPYKTLAEAFADAVDGDTIELVENVSESITIAAGKTVTLDLGGKTLTATGDAITNNGTLTLQNGAITATGAIVRNLGSNSAVTVESGTYTSTGGNGIICGSSDKTVAAPTATGCSVTVNGGTFNVVEMAFATGRTAGATITVNGGTFTSSDNALIGDNGTAGCSGNVITVNGGTFNGSITTAGYIACGIYVANNDTVSVNGGTFTIAGGCGIAVRAGVVTVADGVTIAATGTATGWVGDKKRELPCAAVIYDVNPGAYPGYDSATSKVAITGGILTSDVAAVQMFGDGLVTTTDNTLTVADGYKWAATETVGVYKLAVKSGIDPTDPTSSQEVVIEPTGDADTDKETAIAQAEVTVPEAVSSAVETAAQAADKTPEELYKSYFKLEAVETSEGSGVYNVTIVDIADDVKEEVAETAAEAIAANDVDVDGNVTVTVKPGLYYGFDANEDLGSLGEPTLELATDTSIKVQKPGTTKGFIKVKIGTSAN